MMNRPSIIAELSANHGGKLAHAIELVEAAQWAGADAVKLQTWKPGTMAIPGCIAPAPWRGKSLAKLYDEAMLSWYHQGEVFKHAKKVGIECFSTPFDLPSLKYLQTLEAKRYKIASLEIVDTTLIKACALTGKPLIISTGGANGREIDTAVAAASGAASITLLICTTAYPAQPRDAMLGDIKVMRSIFGCDNIGLSDHTQGIAVPIAAAALGACMIEKHIRLSHVTTCDAEFSIKPLDFKHMVDCVREAAEACDPASARPRPLDSERAMVKMRRSLYYALDMKKGQRVRTLDIVSRRPALGLSPARISDVVGKALNKGVKQWDPVLTEHLRK